MKRMRHILSTGLTLLTILSAVPCALAQDDVRITEFMAANSRTLKDENGDYSDWIEIYNAGSNTVNLLNWSLTDSAGNLNKWLFPATNLAPSQFMIVFASGKDRRTNGAPLHTNFKLEATGEFLALVRPDGHTIATQFAPRFPAQVTDVSYGFGIEQTNFVVMPSNAAVRAFVPADGSLGATWTALDFDDSGWISGTNGVGYDTGAVNPGEDLVSSIILQSGPVGYWRLNEASGTTAANLVPGGVAGTYYSVTSAAGPRPPTYGGFEANNNAAGLNGTSGYIGTGSSLLSSRASFTMAGWIRLGATPAARTGLFGQNDVCEFGFNAVTSIQIWTPGGGSLAVNHAFQVNEWHHVAAVGDGTSLKIYFDGVLQGTGGSSTTSYGTSSSPFNIGGGGVFDTSGNFFNGQIDEVALWYRALTAVEIQQQYQAAITPSAAGGYTNLIGCDLRTAMFGVNSSAYVRYLFNVADPSQIDRLTLNLKYDDGFVAYLNGVQVAARNAPDVPQWNSSATTYNPDGSALLGESFNVSGSLGALMPGTNVLAIQGLNSSVTNADFLVAAELIAVSAGQWTAAPRYFTIPTPGDYNGVGTTDLGPIISGVGRAPAVPQLLTTNDPITVTARVQMGFAPVTNAVLYWRVMFGATNQLPMFDDGQHGDGLTNDSIFAATIPAGVATNGQMVRWFIQARDAAGRVSRWPLFANPLENAEYEGTMIHNPAVVSQLPIWHFFVDPNSPNMANMDSETAGRGSMFFDGELYDNIEISLRGNTTAAYPKKSHHINFNSEKPLQYAGPGTSVRHTSLLSETADPAYLRSYLSYWLLDLMGVPSPFDYPVHCRLNNAFWGLYFHNDTMGPDQLQRLGYDGLGALYKAAGTITTDYYSTGGFEKRTRLWESRSDYDTLARSISETNALAARKSFIFDNLNVPEIVNYLATMRWTQEGDDVWANMTMYRDTMGTKEWFIIPFDLNVSWGQLFCGDNTSFTSVTGADDTQKGHPLYGGSQVVPAYRTGVWNRMYDVIIAVPETRNMLLRRERTLLEKFIQPPGTPFEQGLLEQHIAYMTNLMWPEMFMDRAKWGWPCTTVGTACGMYCWGPAWPTNETYGIPALINNYINPRRTHWWVTHCVTNTAKAIGLGNAFNAGIPTGQPLNAFLSVASLDFNPASGNQAEEYVCLTNAGPFAIDISGWKLDGAVQFTFKPGTIVPSNSTIYVSPDVVAFRGRTTGPRGGQGLFVVGPYKGQLSARGETITIKDDRGVVITTNNYAGSPTLAQQYLRVTEIMYHPSALAGNPTLPDEFEYLELKNISSSVTLDLAGVRFINGLEFNFTGSSATNLAPGQTVLIVKNLAAFTARHGGGFNIAGQYVGNLDNGGDRLQLVDASGEEVLDFSYNNSWYRMTDGQGFSLVVVNENAEPDSWNDKSNWRPSGQLGGSPAGPDPAPPLTAPILVNEALTRTEVPPPTDSIELYNPTGTNVDIGGWFLSDDFNTPKKFRIPTNTTITAGSYVVFTESDFNPTPGVPPSFALGSDGDEVYLFSADLAGNLTGYFHGYAFGAAEDGVSFGRYVTSDGDEHFVAQATRTLGATNTGPRVGPVVINEIMYHPPEIGTGDNSADEFIELYNSASTNVALFDPLLPANTWKVGGGISLVFPTNVTLAAGEYVLLVNFNPAADPIALAAFRAKYGVGTGVQLFGPYGGKLNNDGDNIELKKPTTPIPGNVPYVLVDKVAYHDSAPWPAGADGFGLSLQRKNVAAYGNDPANWVAAAPSAAAANPAAGVPPAITVQPQGQTVVAFSDVVLSVTATGSGPLRYQWRFDGVNIDGATNAALNLPNLQPTQIGDYRVLVCNDAGSAVSSNATLAVVYPATILSQPQSMAVKVTSNVTFSVSAYSPTPLSYQWRWNGANIPNATNASYTITSVQITNEGVYQVVVTDAVGPILSAPATLTPLYAITYTQSPQNQTNVVGATVSFSAAIVGYPPPFTFEFRKVSTPLTSIVTYQSNCIFTLTNIQYSDAGQYRIVASNLATASAMKAANLTVLSAPIIVNQPSNQWANPGGSASFVVKVTGTANFSYQWYFNGTNPVGPTILNTNYATNTLVLTNVQGTNLGDYLVVVTNRYGAVTSEVASLSFRSPPVIVSQPADQTVVAGEDASFNVVADGGGPYGYRWYRNGTNAVTAWTGNPSLVISNAQAANAGTYWVAVTNGMGATSSEVATLTVLLPPAIVAQPTNQTVVAGSNATFTVVASGTEPLSYRWIWNGTTELPGATNASLSWEGVQAVQAGDYQVVVSNPYGAVTSAVARLSVLEPPFILTDPADQAVGIGAQATFSVEAGGTAPLGYQWYFNETNLLSGATNASLLLTNVQAGQTGDYHVVVSNPYGVATSAVARLILSEPPMIITQPADQAVEIGETATFTVAASGSGPLSYQWYWDGTTELAGATNASLVLTNVQPANEGSYSVVVSNGGGSTTSQPAQLVVLTAPTLRDPRLLPNGDFAMQLEGRTDRHYVIEVSTNLTDWAVLQTITATNASMPVLDTSTAGASNRFYRARATP